MAPRADVDVILITIDTWRADRLGVYGSPRSATSKHLEEWARSGILFEQAWAPSPWTLPTMASIATGLYPSAHGAVSQDSGLCNTPDTLAEVLHASGRRTGFAGSNGYFEPAEPDPRDAGLAQGFEYFWGRGLEKGPRVLEYAGYFLDGVPDDQPTFLHIHLFDPHCPYDPPKEAIQAASSAAFGLASGADEQVREGFPAVVRVSGACHFVPVLPRGLPDREVAEMQPGTELQAYLDAYDGSLVVTDRLLGEIAKLLETHDRWRRAWIVVTGDHGEEFGDHGRLGHGKNTYAETTRVPLLIRPPLGETGWATGRRVPTPVSLVDLPVTIASLVGATVPASWQGRDLTPALRGEALAEQPILAETDYETTSRLLIAGGLALHRDLVDGRRLYRLASDPNMGAPLALETPEAAMAASRMDELLATRERQIAEGRMCQASTRAMTPAQLEALKALGYLGDATPNPD
jgi:hypothetical protein